jgi:uncharacterized linocin/CFP29 family protein
MAYDYSPITWTDEQWARVTDTIQQEASRARVAATFLPLYGPLPADTDYVSKDEITEPPPVGAAPAAGAPGPSPGTMTIDDTNTLTVPTLQVKVKVRGAQMADPELTSVLALFRRAANVLARLEDAVVFQGQLGADQGPPVAYTDLPATWEVRGGQPSQGLLGQGSARTVANTASGLVTEVSGAIGDLDQSGHFGPFAVVLAQDLFTTAQTPSPGSLVLPQDRIIPFLEGAPLLRSTLVPNGHGIVVALGGAPVELVVATDMSLNFLQVTTDPMYVFRVFEKVVLRIKEPTAIVRLTPPRSTAASRKAGTTPPRKAGSRSSASGTTPPRKGGSRSSASGTTPPRKSGSRSTAAGTPPPSE